MHIRMSTAIQQEIFKDRLDDVASRLTKAYEGVTTWKKFTTSSEEPILFSSVQKHHSLKNALEQYNKNITEVSGNRKFALEALNDSYKLLTTAKINAQKGATASTSQEARKALANEVAALQKKLVDLGNIKDQYNKDYLFSGTTTDTQPFAPTSGVLNYNGNTTVHQVEVGPKISIDRNVLTNTSFITAYQNLESLRNNLLSGNQSAMSSIDMKNLQDSMDAFNTLRANIGIDIKYLTEKSQENQSRTDQLVIDISEKEELGLEAITEFRQALDALKATNKVWGMMDKSPNIFDYITR